ncbi:MAG: hypothetical protein UU08_C0001G0030 [Candidatus Uhrbacteria bacterium GW2011_GWE2_40_58]|nr:MAG: hypothetical protein UT94_C0001G0030 [Candidatus Uhrbacteria bacterium GW2011_GWF2_40_263]KKR68256.1 MAG: hypothetical protein UU08_C0001G0030 [Candidatus Uhrbacteria bacterium GW2011_GWE2_40_58]OGL92057.1 MAG: hypothetical protein A2239_03535 [Candidatus Uhrbacteria bacterium RIFOXYA2_FULL_40_9]OGL97515.1 MAG: hypothetical protein A2332_00240 [Candidatus Uhrbacteria bacterium RIFOXYB2_FULL_41_18]HBK35096.1 hypothetical protein [Candidatus Uhrbacteria bacterium]
MSQPFSEQVRSHAKLPKGSVHFFVTLLWYATGTELLLLSLYEHYTEANLLWTILFPYFFLSLLLTGYALVRHSYPLLRPLAYLKEYQGKNLKEIWITVWDRTFVGDGIKQAIFSGSLLTTVSTEYRNTLRATTYPPEQMLEQEAEFLLSVHVGSLEDEWEAHIYAWLSWKKMYERTLRNWKIVLIPSEGETAHQVFCRLMDEDGQTLFLSLHDLFAWLQGRECIDQRETQTWIQSLQGFVKVNANLIRTIHTQESAIEFARSDAEAQIKSQKEERLKYLNILIELAIWLNEMSSSTPEMLQKQKDLLELLRREITEDNPLYEEMENRLSRLRLV